MFHKIFLSVVNFFDRLILREKNPKWRKQLLIHAKGGKKVAGRKHKLRCVHCIIFFLRKTFT